jgi:plastocyanin
MDERNAVTRRYLIRLVGSIAPLGLAGCVGSQTEASTEPAGRDDDSRTETAASGQDDADDHDEGGHHRDEGGHHYGDTVPEEPARSAELTMLTTDDGSHFHPHVVWVQPGGTVTFHNESGAHSATAYAPANDMPSRIPEAAEAFDSGTLTESGATFEHTFETEGVYDLFCAPHHQLGMVASVIVGKPDPEGQPGLAEPQSAIPAQARTRIHELNGLCHEALDHFAGHHE